MGGAIIVSSHAEVSTIPCLASIFLVTRLCLAGALRRRLRLLNEAEPQKHCVPRQSLETRQSTIPCLGLWSH